MHTFKELLEKAEVAKKAGDHEKALGILTYAHELIGHTEEGFQATALLSSVYKDVGMMDKAFTLLRAAAEVLEKKELYGDAGGVYVALTCGSLYTPGITMEHYGSLAKKVALYFERHVRRVSHLKHDYTVGRKLKIGILSPDLCMHSLAYLITQPLINFTKLTQHELYLYHLRAHTDAVTDQLAKAATKFEHVHSYSDDQITQLIVDDKIDVLIDISGFTAETRLSVYARQPAPVQIGWISGMMTPTGLSSIPYFITDQYMNPGNLDPQLCTAITLPTPLTYHTLREKEPEIGPAPLDRNGYVSFASFNNPCKINSDVLKAWAEILGKTPKSRLHLKTYSSLDSTRIAHYFTKTGIDPSRLVLMPTLPSTTDVQNYYSQHIDIFLDAWPCSGCLTTVEALWMGVPVVSYYTDVFCSRQTHSILNNIGITDLSHATVEQYVLSAIKLAGMPTRIKKLRTELRGMLSKSPLCNYRQMALDLGKACEDAWSQVAIPRKQALDLLPSRT